MFKGLSAALLMLGAVIVVQQLEGNVVYPFLVGRQVDLHPVLIVLAISGGSLFAGILGAFLAVPVAAVALSSYSYLSSPAGRQ